MYYGMYLGATAHALHVQHADSNMCKHSYNDKAVLAEEEVVWDHNVLSNACCMLKVPYSLQCPISCHAAYEGQLCNLFLHSACLFGLLALALARCT